LASIFEAFESGSCKALIAQGYMASLIEIIRNSTMIRSRTYVDANYIAHIFA